MGLCEMGRLPAEKVGDFLFRHLESTRTGSETGLRFNLPAFGRKIR
jgi:hypothetical protein